MSEDPRFGVAEIREQCVAILRAWGFPEEPARTAAEVMADTDAAGIDSHGLSMFINYERLFHGGKLNPAAVPTVVREHGCTALLDGQHGLGHPAAVTGMRLAIDKASTTGMGAVSVFNSNHFGAAGYYAALAARSGYVGMVTTSARTTAVVPTGGAEPRLSTNPLAFAAPARRHEPFLLDMSTSTVPINKIKMYDMRGESLPAGWFVDASGDAVTDAGVALRAAWEGLGGGLTPVGEHKGYGLSVMVQLLSSALSGGGLSLRRDDAGPDNIGHFLLVIDPAAFRPGDEFLDDVDEVIDAMHATPPACEDGEVLVAGEPEARARAWHAEHGITVSKTLLETLAGICERTGAPLVLRPGQRS